MTFKEVMTGIADGFEAFGAAVLIVGFAVGFTRAALAVVRRAPGAAVYRSLRSFVGRTILLGLEVLVAADLIRTVAVEPSWESVGTLAVIVLIRTFLSFALDVEIDGRFPWARERAGERRAVDVAHALPDRPVRRVTEPGSSGEGRTAGGTTT